MEETNPYAAPKTVDDAVVREPGRARRLMLAWEPLRLKYNAILAIAGVLVILAYMLGGMPILVGIFGAFFVAIGANLCFLLGPFAEISTCAVMNIDEAPILRRILFFVGTSFSLGVFGLALLPILLF